MTLLEPITLFGYAIAPAWLVVVALIAGTLIEGTYRVLTGRGFDFRDAATNVLVYAGNVVVLALWSPWLFLIYDALHRHALFDLGNEWSMALRQTWMPFLATPFWLVLPWLGFDPLMVLSAQLASLVFQSLLHTELVGRLGPLGWVFNTPGHHRVHHAADEDLLDKNFGGILIVWDRMLGTFHGGTPRSYGTGAERYNPISVSFHEWGVLARDVLRSRSPRQLFVHLFGLPGGQDKEAHRDS